MKVTNADKVQIRRDCVLGHFPLHSACRSAILLRNSLLAVQIYQGHLPNYASTYVALFNTKSSKVIKKLTIALDQAPSNLQQHILLSDQSEKMLVVCDDFAIRVYSIDRAFKIHSKFSFNSTEIPFPLPYVKITQPLTRVRVLNSEEILLARGSSLHRWNFSKDRSVSQLPEFLSFPSNKKIADFDCDFEKQLLFIMLEYIFTNECCEIILYDLEDLIPLSTYKLDFKFVNRFWGLNIESGSISVIQNDLIQKKSVITFIRPDPAFELKLLKKYEIEGWVLNHMLGSKEISCIVVSQMKGSAFKRVWGLFEYAEDRCLKGIYSTREGAEHGELPRSQKFVEYLEGIGCFLGADGGSIFLSRRKRVIKRKVGCSSKEFWAHVSA